MIEGGAAHTKQMRASPASTKRRTPGSTLNGVWRRWKGSWASQEAAGAHGTT